MAHYIKTKASIAVISITVLIFVGYVQYSDEPTVNKHWQPLSWEDFDGRPPLFTKYAAAVSSFIEIEYDSTKSSYVAVAYQSNTGSWVRRDTTKQSLTLEHEQYHFNISEIIARRLNQYIRENPDGDKTLFQLRLESLYIDWNEMQDQYDSETDHSAIFQLQDLWQFKIDSMLMMQNGWHEDRLSGARFHLPAVPDSSTMVHNHVAMRVYSLTRYRMTFMMMSLQNTDLTRADFIKNMITRARPKQQPKLFAIDSSTNVKVTMVKESKGYRSKIVWQMIDPYIYYIESSYPISTADTLGYDRIASSFINSLNVVTTDDYWAHNYTKDSLRVIVTKLRDDSPSARKQAKRGYVLKADTLRGIYRGPIEVDNKYELFVYDFANKYDSSHLEDVALINDRVYRFKPKNIQTFLIPKSLVPKTDFEMSIGYILKQDSAKTYPPMYRQVIRVKGVR